MRENKSYRWKLCVALLLLVLGTSTCSEVIDLDGDQESGQVVIFGRLTNGAWGNFVEVSATGPQGGVPVPETTAIVQISNDRGETERMFHIDSGRYEFPAGTTFGEEGVGYTLTVSAAGVTYTSDMEVIPQNYGRETMSWELRDIESITSSGASITQTVVTVSARTDFDEELPDAFYLRWDIEEAYTYLGTFLPFNRFPRAGGQVQCYVTGDLNEQTIFLYNGEENRATTIADRVFTNRLADASFQTLHYFNLVRNSLTKEAYEYWEKLDQIVNRQGSIFDVPPAGVPGNITASDGREVLGFFEGVASDTTRLALTRNDIRIDFFDACPIQDASEWALIRTVPRDCRQCVVDEGIKPVDCIFCGRTNGNSGVRPPYFD